MTGLRKFIAWVVGLLLAGMLVLGGLRLLNLSGVDIAWFRAIPWLIFFLIVIALGAGLFLLLRKPKRNPTTQTPV